MAPDEGYLSADARDSFARGEIPLTRLAASRRSTLSRKGGGGTVPAAACAVPSRAAQELARDDPVVAVELEHIAVLDRAEILRRGVERDAGHQQRQRHVLQIGRLRHDVLTRQIVLALLQQDDQR